jgi:hypothetical protein
MPNAFLGFKQKSPSCEGLFYKGQKGGLSETGFEW